MKAIEKVHNLYTGYLYASSGLCLGVCLVLLLIPGSSLPWEIPIISFLAACSFLGLLYAWWYREAETPEKAYQQVYRKIDVLCLGEWIFITVGVVIYSFGYSDELPLKWEVFTTLSLLLLMLLPVTGNTYLDRKQLKLLLVKYRTAEDVGGIEEEFIPHPGFLTVPHPIIMGVALSIGVGSGFMWVRTGEEMWFLGIVVAGYLGIWSWVKYLGK